VKRYGKYSGRGVLHNISENTRKKRAGNPNFRLCMGTSFHPLWGHVTLWSLPVAMVLVLLYYYHSKKKARETEKKKYGEKKSTGKTGHAQNILPKKVRETPTSGQKGGKPGWVPMGSRDLRSRHIMTSGSPIGQVTSGSTTTAAPPPQMLICPYPYTTDLEVPHTLLLYNSAFLAYLSRVRLRIMMFNATFNNILE